MEQTARQQVGQVAHTPRSLRARLGLSQETLAERAGVSVGTVRALERGENIHLENLDAIAVALSVTSAELLAARDVERARRAGAAA